MEGGAADLAPVLPHGRATDAGLSKVMVNLLKKRHNRGSPAFGTGACMPPRTANGTICRVRKCIRPMMPNVMKRRREGVRISVRFKVRVVDRCLQKSGLSACGRLIVLPE